MCFAIWQAPLTRMYISRRKCEWCLQWQKNTTRLLGGCQGCCQAVARVFWVVARALLGGCQDVLGGCQVISWAVLHHRKSMGQLWTLLPPRGATLPHFEVWSYRACQPLQMWQISNFCEIHSLSYEASKFFAMLSLCVFLAAISPLGRTSTPDRLKVIAHHSRLGRTF